MTAPILSTKGTPILGRDALAHSAQIARRRLRYRTHQPKGVLWDRLADRTDMNRKHAKSVVLSPAYHIGVTRAFNHVWNLSRKRGEGVVGPTVASLLKPYGPEVRSLSQLIPGAYAARVRKLTQEAQA